MGDTRLDFIAMMGNLVFEEENERVRNLEEERREAERRRLEEARVAAEAERRRRQEAERAEQQRAMGAYMAQVAVDRQRQQQILLQREIQLQRDPASHMRQVVEMCRTCKNNTARHHNCPPEMIYCEAEDEVVRKAITWCAYFVNEQGFTIAGLHLREHL